MPLMPCDTHVDCPGFDGSPVINNSSEAPDILTFRGIAFGPNYNPPLGWNWGNLTQFATCQSTISQEDADACAMSASVAGATGSWVDPSQQSGGGARPTFRNTEQHGTATCPDGSEYSYTVPAGRFVGGSQHAADQAAIDWGNQQAMLHAVCLSELPSPVCQGAELSLNVFASSSFLAPPGANVWTSSTLPPGLTLSSPDTGPAVLSGTPTTPGDYDFVIQVTLPNGDTNDKEYFMTVAGITNANTLPTATQGTAYSATLTAIGFTNPEFSISDVPLPDGLAMDSAGNITGTPANDAVTGSFTVFVRDTVTDFECSQDVTITVMAGGINFNDIVWNNPEDHNHTNGSGVVTFSNSGADFSVDVSAPNDGSSSASFENTNSNLPMPYTGPDVACNLQVTVTAFDQGGDPPSTGDITVTDDIGNTYVNVDLRTLGAPGVYNFPFTVLSGAVHVNVEFDASVNPNTSDAHIAFSCVLTPSH